MISSPLSQCAACNALHSSVPWRERGVARYAVYIYIYIYTVRGLEVETNAVLHCVAWRGARACVCVCECVAALLLEVE